MRATTSCERFELGALHVLSFHAARPANNVGTAHGYLHI